jgi:hypothetical protein
MGRRSRKRSAVGELGPEPEAPAAPPRPAPGAVRRRARASERPAAPWAPVPLTELGTLASLVLLVVGFFAASTLVIVLGFGVLAVLMIELAVREHFAGFRSHSSLLALCAAFGAAAVLIAAGTPHLVQVLVAAAVFAGAFVALRRAFQRRAGGLGFRA